MLLTFFTADIQDWWVGCRLYGTVDLDTTCISLVGRLDVSPPSILASIFHYRLFLQSCHFPSHIHSGYSVCPQMSGTIQKFTNKKINFLSLYPSKVGGELLLIHFFMLLKFSEWHVSVNFSLKTSPVMSWCETATKWLNEKQNTYSVGVNQGIGRRGPRCLKCNLYNLTHHTGRNDINK